MDQLMKNDSGIRRLQVADLVKWVEAQGWRRLAHPNENFFVFADPEIEAETPIIIPIPRHTGFIDAHQRMAEVVQTLAAYYDRTPRVILCEVEAQPPRARLHSLPLNGASASTPKARQTS